jgi:signal recognition particle subunit SRP54
MLQQMQRLRSSGGGMQDMMKAMMQGQGGDQFDMEEMQSMCLFFFLHEAVSLFFVGMMGQMGGGLGGLGGLPGMGGGMPNFGDMFKMMGMGGGAGR